MTKGKVYPITLLPSELNNLSAYFDEKSKKDVSISLSATFKWLVRSPALNVRFTV